MKIPGLSCCLGMIIGMLPAIFLLCAAGYGIYCWINPEARNSAVGAVEEKWNKVKSGGDTIIEKAKNVPPPQEMIKEPQI